MIGFLINEQEMIKKGLEQASLIALNMQSSLKYLGYVNPWLELISFGLDAIHKNGRHIYERNNIIQTILEIDFDLTFVKEPDSLTFFRFGISKHIHNNDSKLL